MPQLDVYLNSTWIGEPPQDNKGLLGFSYREEFLGSPDAAPLSRHLPVEDIIARKNLETWIRKHSA